MLINIRIRAVSLIAMVTLASCGENIPAATTTASQVTISSNGSLTNEYFSMRVNAPDGWYALSDEELRQILNLGGKIATSGNTDLEAVLDATLELQVPLFGIFEHPPGTPVEVNPNVLANAENVQHAPGIKSGADYFFHTKKMFEQSNVKIEYEDGYTQREIGGVTFDRMDVTLTIQGVEIDQSYYAAKYKNYVVMLTATPGDGAADPILEGVSFDW